MVEIPNTPGIYTFTVESPPLPRSARVRLPQPFTVLSSNWVSGSQIQVTAEYAGGLSNGDNISLQIRARKRVIVKQRSVTLTPIETLSDLRIRQPTAIEGLVVQGNDIAFTPTLISGDTGGDWSSTTLPTGASINQSTGTITGTLNTLGKDFVYLTYTKDNQSDTVLFVIHVVDQITTIEGQSITSPINLTHPNRAYRLNGNITASRTAFIMSAIDQLLDLNGYEVNYDSESPIVNFANPDFDGGSTDGWDLSEAQEASVSQGLLANKTAYNDGEYAINFSLNPGQTKTITTTGSFNLVAGEWYCISFWITEIDEGDSVSSIVNIGSNSSNSLSTSEVVGQGGQWRPGSFFYYVFQANQTESSPASFAITNNGVTTKNVYCSKFDIQRALCHGIVGGTGGQFLPNWYPNGIGSSSGYSTICNGTITQIQTSPISDSVTVSNELYLDSVHITNKSRIMTGWGKAAKCLQTFGQYITNSSFTHEAIGIHNRDNEHGWIIVTTSSGRSGGALVFRDNTILKSIQGGFSPSSFNEYTKESIICYNTIATQSRYTNGFGLRASGVSGRLTLCNNNNINYTQGNEDNGRGIRVVSHSILRGNNVIVRSLPLTMEYGGGYTIGGAYAMQLESSSGEGVEFYNEKYTCTGFGGGAAFRVNGPITYPIKVYDCDFEVNSTTPSPYRIATCLKLSEPDTGTLILDSFDIQGCKLKTNQSLIEISTGNVSGILTLTNCLIHIVQDVNYGNNLFLVNTAEVVFVNPSFINQISQTLFEAAVASNPRVSII